MAALPRLQSNVGPRPPTWHYWSDTETNTDGEDLNTCLRKYGTGGYESREKNMKTTLLFLDSTKSESYSWLLCMQRLSTGETGCARLYEEMEHVYHRPGAPPASSGESTASAAADAESASLIISLTAMRSYLASPTISEPGGAHAHAWLQRLCDIIAASDESVFLKLSSVDAAFRVHAGFSVAARAVLDPASAPPTKAALIALLDALIVLLQSAKGRRVNATDGAVPNALCRQLSDEARRRFRAALDEGTEEGEEDHTDDAAERYLTSISPTRGGGGGGSGSKGGVYSAKHIRAQARSAANSKRKR